MVPEPVVDCPAALVVESEAPVVVIMVAASVVSGATVEVSSCRQEVMAVEDRRKEGW